VIKTGLADKNLAAQVPQADAVTAPQAASAQAAPSLPIVAQLVYQDNFAEQAEKPRLDLMIGDRGSVGVYYTEPGCVDNFGDEGNIVTICPHNEYVLPGLSYDQASDTIRLGDEVVARNHRATGSRWSAPQCLETKVECPKTGYIVSAEFKLSANWDHDVVRFNGLHESRRKVIQIVLDRADSK
jgi:hypothetical protein